MAIVSAVITIQAIVLMASRALPGDGTLSGISAATCLLHSPPSGYPTLGWW